MAKAAKAFKQSAAKPVPPFDFEKAVAEAYGLFPEVKDKVFFVDVAANKIVHSDPESRARLLTAMNNDDSTREMINNEIYNHMVNKASSVMELAGNGHKVYFVLLYMKQDMQSALGRKHDLTENMHLVFDHELAHALLKQAHGPKLLSESTADAYAALRHFQRYGTDNQTIEKLMKRRAALGFMNDDADHFTSPVLEKVLEVKDQVDFKALTAQETTLMATFIAQEAKMKKGAIRTLSRHFPKLTTPPNDRKDDSTLRLLAETVFKAKSQEVKKWGTMALQAFLDRDIRIKGADGYVQMTGPYWKGVRQRLAATPN